MSAIVLHNQTVNGDPLEATFLPEKGMNMISYKRNGIEVIDQSTRSLFEERYAGLGALIGPHFHRRSPAILPVIKDESLFPHIARIKAKGVQDPFSHGIARYAPWQAKFSETHVNAVISGKDTWNGVTLASLEGQNFKMEYNASLTPQGLEIGISVVSDSDSVVGLHYYYHLPRGEGTVSGRVQKQYIRDGQLTEIPSDWNFDQQQLLTFPLNQSADYTFHPFPSPLEGKMLLDAGDYRLQITYQCASEENSWQLYHPVGASFVCIEPLSSQDPRHPNLTVSSLNVRLEIMTEQKS